MYVYVSMYELQPLQLTQLHYLLLKLISGPLYIRINEPISVHPLDHAQQQHVLSCILCPTLEPRDVVQSPAKWLLQMSFDSRLKSDF